MQPHNVWMRVSTDAADRAAHSTIRTSVIGASGYGGGELLRLLARHPCIEIVHLAAGSSAGQTLGSVFPSLGHGAASALADRVLVEPDPELIAADSDAVFLALPHGLSLELVPPLLAGEVKVVDLGGDYRLQDRGVFESWYGLEHTAPEILAEAVYGLPELYRERIAASRLVANPGCYPTASILAMLPLVEANWVQGLLLVDAKSGVSGAGRQAKAAFGFSEVNENLRPYSPLGHRHQPEIEAVLGDASSDSPLTVRFVPHLVPMNRGILATCYLTLSEQAEVSQDAVQALYRERYADEPFVRVLKGDALPATKHVAGSNGCEIAVRVDRSQRLVVAMAAIDNLGKGAASAAIANFNLQWGLDETLAVDGAPLFP